MTFVASFPPSLRSGANDTTRATNKLYALQESCDCPIFTWSNRLVHGLGKWHAKIWTGEFCPGIAFTICTNQFHLPKNDREGLKLVSKMALKKWDTNFRLEYSVRKTTTTFSDVPSLPEIFRWNDPNVMFHLVSKRTFRKRFVNSKQPFFPFLSKIDKHAVNNLPPPTPPRFILSYARSTIAKEKIEGLWTSYNPGQNVLGHLRKLGTKTHFAKLTHILPLKKLWDVVIRRYFCCPPLPKAVLIVSN